jgi:hypothetical protein
MTQESAQVEPHFRVVIPADARRASLRALLFPVPIAIPAQINPYFLAVSASWRFK